MAAGAGFAPVGVDRFLRLRPENRHPQISLIQSDARDFHAIKPFDAIAALHVLEHFRDPYTFLKAARDSLTDGGWFLIEVPNYASLSRAAAGHRWRCFVSYHALHLSPKSLSALLARSGFEIVHMETVGCSFTQIVGLATSFILRRLGLPAPRGWEPNGVLRKLIARIEKLFFLGYNLRVVARKI